jgi:methyl-accepting chemotaxis protein
MSLLSTERKTLLVGLLTLVGVIVMATLQYRAISDYQLLGQLRLLVSDVESNIPTLRRNEKDFLARKNPLYQRRFTENFGVIQANIKELRSGLEGQSVGDAEIDRLGKTLDTYQKQFLTMANLQQEIGFNHQEGLYGSMRAAIHRAEDILQALQQYRLLTDMLMLRRHEKDFMLRNDIKYSEKFDTDMAIMQTDLSNAYLHHGARTEIQTALATYEKDFKALVSATRQMGFSDDEGLHKQMHSSIQEAEDTLEVLRQTLLSRESDSGSYMINQIIAFAVVLTLFISTLIRL